MYKLRSKLFVPTLKEIPSEAYIPSHQLLLRAGYIRKQSNGIYQLLPLGYKTLRKLETQVDLMMNALDCDRLELPLLLSDVLWKKSGRWFENEMMVVKDRKGLKYCLAPTHEESITELISNTVNSYKELPIRLYQIGKKFRDEIRPRFGLLRSKEFVMADAYTFDTSEGGARNTYEKFINGYERLLKSLKMEYKKVEADTGKIGGNGSHEFHVVCDYGEDEIVSCVKCNYAANVEMAEYGMKRSGGMISIRDAMGKPCTMVERDDELRIYIHPEHRGLKPMEHIGKVIVDPLNVDLNVYKHVYVYIDIDADFNIQKDMDHVTIDVIQLGVVKESDDCPRCNSGKLNIQRGIEIGHAFLLGTKYSSIFQANYISKSNTKHDIQMGCYGIGVSRFLQAIVESSHDQIGLKWPMSIAPYQVAIIPLTNTKSPSFNTIESSAISLAKTISNTFDVVLDDRYDKTTGYKLTEAKLVGFPILILLGKSYTPTNPILEVFHRSNATTKHIHASQILQHLTTLE